MTTAAWQRWGDGGHIRRREQQFCLFLNGLAGNVQNRFWPIRLAIKGRNIPASRNNDAHRLVASFLFEIFIETLSQEARVAPDNVVFARVVVGGAIEYLCTDPLLCNLVAVAQ